jgi:hypothetical protein
VLVTGTNYTVADSTVSRITQEKVNYRPLVLIRTTQGVGRPGKWCKLYRRRFYCFPIYLKK